MWNYAKLSHLANLYGGPEKLIQFLVDDGIKKGKLKMIPITIIAFLSGVAISPIVNYFKAKRTESQAALEAAKTELIEGIKNYDATHEQEEGGQVG